MQPYVIRGSDYLSKLAHKFGFDADAVWNDPNNSDLRKLRTNPEILLAGDILQVPESSFEPPPAQPLVIGTTNTFTAPAPPTVTIKHKFVGVDPSIYASKAYTVRELDDLKGLQTDADGLVTFEVAVTLESATIRFTETGEEWTLAIGGLDPINSTIGIFQRLQGLGYIGEAKEFDMGDGANNLDILRDGLRALKASGANASGSSSPASQQASPEPSEPSGSADGPSTAASASATSGDPATGTSDAAPQGPASTPSTSNDNAGLADNGTLDADTSSLLVSAYGC